MSASVNLMTERARFIAAGARIGNAWAAVVLGLFILMVPLGGWTWHRRGAVSRQREALDSSYEPIRQLSAANRAVSAQAAELVSREHTPLTLSRRRPFVAVLNTVAEAFAATEGSAHLEGLTYDHDQPAPEGASGPWLLTLNVSCTPSFDITQLVESLERPPFTAAKILSNSPGGEGADRKLYVLQCEL
jgi:hypothetical protein